MIANGLILSFLTESSACHLSGFSFSDDNLSKYQWIFTRFAMCIDIVKICYRNVMGKFCPFLTELSAQNSGGVLSFDIIYKKKKCQ